MPQESRLQSTNTMPSEGNAEGVREEWCTEGCICSTGACDGRIIQFGHQSGHLGECQHGGLQGGEIPLWLANKEVWDGIRVAQEVKSCQEELHQCDVEYQTSALGLLRNMKQSTMYSSSAMVMKTWEHSLATITIPESPTRHPTAGERDEDGDVSSDDDDGVELEPVAELEDVRFLGDLDHLIGEGDWSEGEDKTM
ncbi:hypothetical protein BS47DRAFT_1360747 [Hydnum rufescens UP504]|uniref:Uncharacterized protein n=1 Tax=Hydnum rufescens UP504 TaxID=1448309 RepID=A0A9P6DYK5_9AGAM|nr:hypothetical protein BS47DRAFT_1360747 [Hydnum rufescens UP504]